MSLAGPNVLHLGEHPLPSVANSQLLVRVAYTALNRADTLQRWVLCTWLVPNNEHSWLMLT